MGNKLSCVCIPKPDKVGLLFVSVAFNNPLCHTLTFSVTCLFCLRLVMPHLSQDVLNEKTKQFLHYINLSTFAINECYGKCLKSETQGNFYIYLHLQVLKKVQRDIFNRVNLSNTVLL